MHIPIQYVSKPDHFVCIYIIYMYICIHVIECVNKLGINVQYYISLKIA